MPEISTMSESRYLKKEELAAPMPFIIAKVVQEDVSMENQPAEMKWVAYFDNEEKGLVLNKTNRETIAFLTGKTNTDDWNGEKVTLWNDLSVMYNGKRGGIRVKIPDDFQGPAATAPIPFNPNEHPMAGDDPPVAKEGDLAGVDEQKPEY